MQTAQCRVEIQEQDAIEALTTGYREHAQLIYADPPFFSGRDWTLPNGIVAFSDKWPDLKSYVDWLRGLCPPIPRTA